MAATQTDASEQLLRETAYLIWEQAGRPFGHEELHWNMAKELAEQTPAPNPPAASSTKVPRKKVAGADVAGSPVKRRARKLAPARGAGDNSLYQ